MENGPSDTKPDSCVEPSLDYGRGQGGHRLTLCTNELVVNANNPLSHRQLNIPQDWAQGYYPQELVYIIAWPLKLISKQFAQLDPIYNIYRPSLTRMILVAVSLNHCSIDYYYSSLSVN
jgi:hypothetical protein